MLAHIATKATAKVYFFCQFIPLSRHFYPFFKHPDPQAIHRDHLHNSADHHGRCASAETHMVIGRCRHGYQPTTMSTPDGVNRPRSSPTPLSVTSRLIINHYQTGACPHDHAHAPPARHQTKLPCLHDDGKQGNILIFYYYGHGCRPMAPDGGALKVGQRAKNG